MRRVCVMCPKTGSAELAGGLALPDAGDLPRRIEDQYVARLGELPDEAQRLVLLAAADPVGDSTLIFRAAEVLGLDVRAVNLAVQAGLLDVGANVRFRHPLVRSAAYRAAAASDRRAAHAALAAVTDRGVNPDRRVWHRAHATAGPDEAVAGNSSTPQVVLCVGAGSRRGRLLAAGRDAYPRPGERASRALAAAEAKYAAGDFQAAQVLLAAAEVGPQRLQPLNAELARQTYLEALGAAVYAGLLAHEGTFWRSRAQRAPPRSGRSRWRTRNCCSAAWPCA